jgi:predicted amidophosphoribosyltransferase
MESQGTRVYLKDLFDCSIALGERSVDNKETELGHLFTAAKYNGDEAAMLELARRVVESLSSMKSLSELACISCPPPRPDKDFDLPTHIARIVAKKKGVPFVQLGQWHGQKGQLKGVPAHQKWAELERVGFEVGLEVKKAKGLVLLLDDIYQSGTTLNYLRSRLTAQGVARVASISMVKAARDTDNQ